MNVCSSIEFSNHFHVGLFDTIRTAHLPVRLCTVACLEPSITFDTIRAAYLPVKLCTFAIVRPEELSQ
jgi:hypothetical protein